jgi:hypothetical protein
MAPTPPRVVAECLVLSGASSEMVMNCIGLVVVSETFLHHGCPRSGMRRMHQGFPLEARGHRLMTRSGLSEPRSRALGLLDCHTYQKPPKFSMDAASFGGGGLWHSAEQ